MPPETGGGIWYTTAGGFISSGRVPLTVPETFDGVLVSGQVRIQN